VLLLFNATISTLEFSITLACSYRVMCLVSRKIFQSVYVAVYLKEMQNTVKNMLAKATAFVII